MDRRKNSRYAVSGFVHIQTALGPSRECRLTEISDGGVRLYAEGLRVADEFALRFPDPGMQRRRCRVVWQLGPEIGAEFIDQPREFAHAFSRSQFGVRVADHSP